MAARLALGRSLCADLGSQLHEPWHRMVQERPVCFAVETLLAKIVFVERGAVFHAAASTNGQMAAHEAFVAQVALGPREGPLLLAGCQFIYRRFEDVAQSPFRFDEEITGKDLTIMFDHYVLAALLVECADRMSARDIIRQQRVKVANAQF